MISVEIKDEVRRNVEEDLPMLQEIKDEKLRSLVVEAWALSLTLNGFTAVHDLQGSGITDILVLKEGQQNKHLNAVARIALNIGKAVLEEWPDNPLNLDYLVAGALLHDVGKPPEYNVEKMKLWKEKPYLMGCPSASHSAYGYYICMTVGLPEEVCHIPSVHDAEGDLPGMMRSQEATIVHQADGLAWFCPMLAGDLDPKYPFTQIKSFPYKKMGEI